MKLQKALRISVPTETMEALARVAETHNTTPEAVARKLLEAVTPFMNPVSVPDIPAPEKWGTAVPEESEPAGCSR